VYQTSSLRICRHAHTHTHTQSKVYGSRYTAIATQFTNTGMLCLISLHACNCKAVMDQVSTTTARVVLKTSVGIQIGPNTFPPNLMTKKKKLSGCTRLVMQLIRRLIGVSATCDIGKYYQTNADLRSYSLRSLQNLYRVPGWYACAY